MRATVDPPIHLRRLATLALATTLAACSQPIDLDMRGLIGGSVDTRDAALQATADRPAPDDRGVISYPGYQVAVARRGDSVTDVARRVGLPAAELARYNGLRADDPLRRDEVLALPRRVSEPSRETGAEAPGPIRPAAEVDVATLAAGAIDRADPTPARVPDTPQTGVEPVRHRVAPGETAFTISRLYDVSPRALAEWNGLGPDFAIREDQFLLIPTAQDTRGDSTAAEDRRVIEPGQGSPTPVPPSAARPLPQETPPPARTTPEPSPAAQTTTDPEATAPVADIGQDAARPPGGAMILPVAGSVVRAFTPGRTRGITLSAPAGTPVKAAASGSVLHVGATDDGVQFLLLQHPDGLVTAYLIVDAVKVAKGDAVSRGQTIAEVADRDPSVMEFQVRKGMEPTDPGPYLD
jgi:murein DD-endopeptidase MepM/ murein hydrolase activator NlpD